MDPPSFSNVVTLPPRTFFHPRTPGPNHIEGSHFPQFGRRKKSWRQGNYCTTCIYQSLRGKPFWNRMLWGSDVNWAAVSFSQCPIASIDGPSSSHHIQRKSAVSLYLSWIRDMRFPSSMSTCGFRPSASLGPSWSFHPSGWHTQHVHRLWAKPSRSVPRSPTSSHSPAVEPDVAKSSETVIPLYLGPPACKYVYVYICVETPVADRLQSIKNPSGDPFQLQPMNVLADTTIDMLAPGRKTWLRHSWKSTRLLNYKKFEPRLLLTRLQLLRIESLLIGARHIGAGDLWSLPSGIFCCITFGDETAQII